MALFRLLFLGLVAAFVICTLLHRTTGQPVWRQRAVEVLKWGVVVGLLAFGMVILRRAAVFI